jgi:hypothetical protein
MNFKASCVDGLVLPRCKIPFPETCEYTIVPVAISRRGPIPQGIPRRPKAASLGMTNQVTNKLLASIFLTLACSVGAQDGLRSTTGTVVVIGWSRAKIVIAVDSRGFDDNEKYRDDICKIVELDGHSVFTAAGNIIHAHNGRALWNAQKAAMHAFQEAQSTGTQRLLKAAARSWGEHMVTTINQALKDDPAGSKLMLDKNIFLTGAFLGFENGSTAMYQVEIVFDPSTQQAKESSYTERHTTTIEFGALGRNEIVNEIVADKTRFAKTEQRKWISAERDIPIKDRDVRWAIRLVQLTMEYHPQRSDVGGPIDALEIARRGIRWVERKTGCSP